MSRSFALLAASLLVSVMAEGLGHADKLPEDAIVLAAGKRNFVVVLPPHPFPADYPKGFKLAETTVYFGDAKTLVKVPREAFDFDTADDRESWSFGHPRLLDNGTLERRGDKYELHCYTRGDQGEKRSIKLTPANATAVARATLREQGPVRVSWLLARVDGGTTYLYVDKLGDDGFTEPRVFLGKRGAMKQLKIKDMADDTETLVIETPKGTLTVKKAKTKQDSATATFGPAKKPAPLAVVPAYPNRQLIYKELGVYTRERLVHPCEDL